MKNRKVITVEVDVSKPVLDVLVESINDFFNDLLDDIPDTYYVDIRVGNDHPELVTIPLSKIFTGQGGSIQIPPSLRK
jgi:hypothetical protein